MMNQVITFRLRYFNIKDKIFSLEHQLSTTPSTVPQEAQQSNHYLGYKIVGDNIDKTVKARYMRVDGYRNQSLHYFHSLALQSRIDFSHLPNVHPATCSPSPLLMAESLLPTASDDQSLRDLFIMHVSRVLATHIPFFKLAFEDVVERHRKHDYYKQMSSESVVVSSCNNKLYKINNANAYYFHAGASWSARQK